MSAAVVVSPLLGAAAVNGLCGALVLNDVPCGYERCNNGVLDSGRPVISHQACRGSGFLAPSVQVGQRLAIATTHTEPDLQSDSPHMDGSWHWSWNKYPDRPGKTGARFNAEASAVLREGVHLGAVVGSVTATTPALPIYDDRWPPPTKDPYLEVSGDRLVLWSEAHTTPFGGYTDLSEFLPWLGDDLVGRSAVLITDPTPTAERCPRAECASGWIRASFKASEAAPCPVCQGAQTCAPVPLPDGVDLTEGTLTEVQW